MARKKGALVTEAARELALLRWRGLGPLERRVITEHMRKKRWPAKEKTQEKSEQAEEHP